MKRRKLFRNILVAGIAGAAGYAGYKTYRTYRTPHLDELAGLPLAVRPAALDIAGQRWRRTLFEYSSTSTFHVHEHGRTTKARQLRMSSKTLRVPGC